MRGKASRQGADLLKKLNYARHHDQAEAVPQDSRALSKSTLGGGAHLGARCWRRRTYGLCAYSLGMLRRGIQLRPLALRAVS